MGDPGACPHVSQLEKLRLGLLSEGNACAIEDHILSCDKCSAALDRMIVTDELDQLVGQALGGAVAPEEDEAELADIVRRLNAAIRQPVAPPTLELPVTIGEFQLLSELGRGGMGVVYLANDTRLGRQAAIKVMSPEIVHDQESKERFLREGRALAAIESDHVVKIYRVGEDGGYSYLAMQLLQGQSLHDWLAAGNRPTLQQVVRIGEEIAMGLAAAHAKDLVHRDIKPANVWLEPCPPSGGSTTDDFSYRVRILDFGLAYHVSNEEHLTKTGRVLGTPGYTCPEQVNDEELRACSDLFLLGCVLYRLIVGKVPFPGRTLLANARSLAVYVVPPPHVIRADVPRALSNLIMELLEREPARRPQSADEVVRRLRNIEPGPTPVRARKWAMPFVLGCLMLLFGWLVLRIGMGQDPAADNPSASVDSVPLAQTSYIGNGIWKIDGEELHQDSYYPSRLTFGDPDWTDYDFSVEARKPVDDRNYLCLLVRFLDPGGGYCFYAGGDNNRAHVLSSLNSLVAGRLLEAPGSVGNDEWIKLRVRVRGGIITCFVNDAAVLTTSNHDHARGCVALETNRTPARFRNIQVTGPDGSVLFAGLPSLQNLRRFHVRDTVPISYEGEVAWRHTFSEPGDSWFLSDFDDAGWPEGRAPFASPSTVGSQTRWTERKIWLRRSFILPQPQLDNPNLLISVRDSATVYLNGVLAASNIPHHHCGYRHVPIRPEARRTLRPGKNHMAVVAESSGANGFIDVGIADIGAESYVDSEAVDPGEQKDGNAFWRTEGEELVQPTAVHDCRVFFGKPDWNDCDIRFDAQRTAGDDGFSVFFGVQDMHHFLQAVFACERNSRHLLYRTTYVEQPPMENKPAGGFEKLTLLAPTRSGCLLARRWYKVRVTIRGNHVQGFLDDEMTFSFRDDRPCRGAVGLQTWSPYRFRNIRVTDADGKILWAGPPRLPSITDRPSSHIPVTGLEMPGVEQLDAVMLTALAHPEARAIALALGHQGKPLYSRGYGWRDRKRTQPALPDALIGTTSNVEAQAIRAVIRDLVSRGKLAMTDKLLTLLPEGETTKLADARAANITVAHLLNMTPGWAKDADEKAAVKARAAKLPEPFRAETLLPFILAEPLLHDPGSKRIVCWFNNGLLCALVEKHTGKTLAKYMREDLFRPQRVPEFYDLDPAMPRESRAVWNVDNSGSSICASAPGICQMLYHFAPDGERQLGWGWKGAFHWIGSSRIHMSWRHDGIDYVVMTNGPLKADYPWTLEIDAAILRMKQLWLVGS